MNADDLLQVYADYDKFMRDMAQPMLTTDRVQKLTDEVGRLVHLLARRIQEQLTQQDGIRNAARNYEDLCLKVTGMQTKINENAREAAKWREMYARVCRDRGRVVKRNEILGSELHKCKQAMSNSAEELVAIIERKERTIEQQAAKIHLMQSIATMPIKHAPALRDEIVGKASKDT